MSKKTAAGSGLQRIPGIGPAIARNLEAIGVRSVGQLRGADPQLLYDKLCRLKAHRVDRCVLYAFRCAVYYASHRNHDPELLKWWNWKDR